MSKPTLVFQGPIFTRSGFKVEGNVLVAED